MNGLGLNPLNQVYVFNQTLVIREIGDCVRNVLIP